MKKKNLKKAGIGLGIFCVFLVVLYFLQALLMPKYMTSIKEGAMIAEYYDNQEPHSVVFIGDCECYESYSPISLWREYGISSYIRGSAEQLIWQSYYLMEETLQYEKPDVFVFNIQSVQFGTPQREEYNRMSLDGMRWSMSKVRSIKASNMGDESFMSYVFPILRYHERVTEITQEDFKYLFHRDPVTHNGYLMNVGIEPHTTDQFVKPLEDYTISDVCFEYLDKMIDLCEKNDVQLIFVKAPSISVLWYDEWEEQIVQYAAEKGIPYYNFLEKIDEIGLDFTVDTYDHGQHLNLTGAEKLSTYFGRILAEDFRIEDQRGDAKMVAIWEEKCEAYDAERDRLYAEWAEQTASEE